MVTYADLPTPVDGKFAANITHFGRALRKAGLPVGPGRIVDAIKAVEAAGFTDRDDFYWTLHACFVSKPEHRTLFRQTFRLFWRDPQFLEQMMSAMLPMMRGVAEEHKPEDAERRAAEALLDGAEQPKPPENQEEDELVEIDASLTFSGEEKLKSQDFEQMTAAEQAEALRAISKLDLPVRPIASRRTRSAALGRYPDWRGTMRQAMRHGGEVRSLAMKERRTPLAIADCALRYFRVDERIQPDAAPFPSRRIERQGRGMGRCSFLYVRHAPHEHHPASESTRRRQRPAPCWR